MYYEKLPGFQIFTLLLLSFERQRKVNTSKRKKDTHAFVGLLLKCLQKPKLGQVRDLRLNPGLSQGDTG